MRSVITGPRPQFPKRRPCCYNTLMFDRFTRDPNLVWLIGGAVLVIALVATYANHFHNSFHFDDAHTIVNNAAIRDLRNIPAFFRDASTFSSLPSNQSYRPLVSTLLAIDYRLGGLQPFWFHLSIFAVFVALTLLLVFVIYGLLNNALNCEANSWIALAAAGLYALHPANADTVNYIIASSEVVSTLGVVASFAVYFAFPNLRRYYLYVLPSALGILAKPPAAIFAVLFATYRLLFGRKDARLTETWLQRIAQIAIPFIVCGAALLLVQHMTPRNWIAGGCERAELSDHATIRRAALREDVLLARRSLRRLRFEPIHDDRRSALLARLCLYYAFHRGSNHRRGFQENTSDRFRSSLVSHCAFAYFAVPTRRSDERSPYVSSVHWFRDRDCWGCVAARRSTSHT